MFRHILRTKVVSKTFKSKTFNASGISLIKTFRECSTNGAKRDIQYFDIEAYINECRSMIRSPEFNWGKFFTSYRPEYLALRATLSMGLASAGALCWAGYEVARPSGEGCMGSSTFGGRIFSFVVYSAGGVFIGAAPVALVFTYLPIPTAICFVCCALTGQGIA